MNPNAGPVRLGDRIAHLSARGIEHRDEPEQSQPGFSIDPSRVHMTPEVAEEASRVIASMQSGSFEERLARLERQSGSILKLLQQVVDAVRIRPGSKADQS